MKANLILNGEEPNEKTTKEIDFSLFTVCADGGYNFMAQNSLEPFVVIGDNDSNEYSFKNIIKYKPEKDFTDGFLALDYLIQNSYDEIYIYGGGGKRDDHFLANIGLLKYAYKNNVKAYMVTNYSTISYHKKSENFKINKNTTFSIVPLSSELHIMDITGAKYKLFDKKVNAFSDLCISNVSESDEVGVIIKDGEYLFISVK